MYLLETVGVHRTRLDETLEASADRWSLERMAVVDRSLLRLGAALQHGRGGKEGALEGISLHAELQFRI